MLPLTKCDLCGVPAIECIPACGPHFTERWCCRPCRKEIEIRCSYCDALFDECMELPEALDDQSFLCPECNTQLLEELDDFTNNYESYTEGPTGTPWYQHRLSATPGK